MSFNSYRAVETVWWVFIFCFVAAIVYGLTGCTPAVVKPVIDIQRPVLPEVPASNLDCLDLDTYIQLRNRDVLLHQYAQELELIICEVAECPR